MTKILSAQKANSLKGTATIPGDKSISHRSLMFGGIAVGETIIHGLLEGEDVIATANAMRAMGASIEKDQEGVWHCHGVGIGGLQEPSETLDMGNSGTSTRLLMGLIGGHNISVQLTGDASLTKRPMNRVIKPLEQMGAQIMAREGGRLPLTLKGAEDTLPITYDLPVASAQVKSCVLLAGLSAMGQTSVIEHIPTRDHTENMLRHFGVDVTVEELEDNAQKISVAGQKDLKGTTIHVPRDPSSAGFPAVAAAIIQDSEIELPNILMNGRRSGLYTTLIEMGANIEFKNERIEAGEKVADLVIKGNSELKGIEVPPSRVPSMIDEFPILFVAASCANGTTTMRGLHELRVKESDRLLMMAKGLEACGVNLEMGEDSLIIHGNGKPPRGGARIETALDHRIAMSFLILGCVTDEPITIDDAEPIQTSFPNFVELMNGLGASIN
ncbi:MAG: 3-phosphoshikimate 1-carboxyvinyltransferase [Pseudomonadota bacterium]